MQARGVLAGERSELLWRDEALLEQSVGVGQYVGHYGHVEVADIGAQHGLERGAEGVGGALAAAVQAAIAETSLFAAGDLHNNTGHNPYYSVLTDLEPHNLGLAYLFSDKAVYVQEPDTVCTKIFVGRCPAVTLEVGPVGDPRCALRVVDYLERCMNLTDVPSAPPSAFSLFRTRVRVHVRDGVDR